MQIFEEKINADQQNQTLGFEFEYAKSILLMEDDDYKNENAKLKELFLARQKRSKKAEQPQEPISEATKTIRTVQEPPKVARISSDNPIHVNTLVYDNRPVEEKTHCITLANLLHENMQINRRKPMSSEVLSIMVTTYGFEWEVFGPVAQSGKPLFIFNRDDAATNSIQRGFNDMDNVVIISPPKSNTGYGVFHPKLWLVKFKTFLRVIVGTGNNHLCDWAVWQNAWWHHDCPLKNKEQSNINQSNEKVQNEQKEWGVVKNFDYVNDFVTTLKWAIAEMQPKGFNVLHQMQINIQDYSFEGIKAILIPSFPGRFQGAEMEKIGLSKVRSIMRRHQKQFKNPTLTSNSTSLGPVNEKLLQQIYRSFNPHALFKISNFRLVYPTSQYIQWQTCNQSEVLFLTEENYKKNGVKKEVFYRYEKGENGVQGNIPHLKTIIIEQQGEKQRCVLFLGSHNLTKAAWGTYEKGDTQLNCSNSELGVLILDYSLEELKQWLPYRLPPTPYSSKDKPFLRVL